MVIEGTSSGSAMVSSYLVLQDHGVSPAVARITGVYHDELVKTAKGWLFKKRVVETDSPAAAQHSDRRDWSNKRTGCVA